MARVSSAVSAAHGLTHQSALHRYQKVSCNAMPKVGLTRIGMRRSDPSPFCDSTAAGVGANRCLMSCRRGPWGGRTRAGQLPGQPVEDPVDLASPGRLPQRFKKQVGRTVRSANALESHEIVGQPLRADACRGPAGIYKNLGREPVSTAAIEVERRRSEVAASPRRTRRRSAKPEQGMWSRAAVSSLGSAGHNGAIPGSPASEYRLWSCALRSVRQQTCEGIWCAAHGAAMSAQKTYAPARRRRQSVGLCTPEGLLGPGERQRPADVDGWWHS